MADFGMPWDGTPERPVRTSVSFKSVSRSRWRHARQTLAARGIPRQRNVRRRRTRSRWPRGRRERLCASGRGTLRNRPCMGTVRCLHLSLWTMRRGGRRDRRARGDTAARAPPARAPQAGAGARLAGVSHQGRVAGSCGRARARARTSKDPPCRGHRSRLGREPRLRRGARRRPGQLLEVK